MRIKLINGLLCFSFSFPATKIFSKKSEWAKKNIVITIRNATRPTSLLLHLEPGN